jgi:hypothetical protein
MNSKRCHNLTAPRGGVLNSTANKEFQGGLEGPGYMSSEVVIPNEADGIVDGRFFKKGRMY